MQNTERYGNGMQETLTGKEKDSENKIICQPIGLGFARTIEKLMP
jgi:hypothetical protein